MQVTKSHDTTALGSVATTRRQFSIVVLYTPARILAEVRIVTTMGTTGADGL